MESLLKVCKVVTVQVKKGKDETTEVSEAKVHIHGVWILL